MLQVHGTQSSFIDRVIGVMTLDVPTYRRIALDRSGTIQAAGVVGIAAVAAAIGRVSQYGWLMTALMVTVIGWVIASGRGYAVIAGITGRHGHRSRVPDIWGNLDRRQRIGVSATLFALLCLIVLGIDGDALGWSTVALSVPFISWISFSAVAWYLAGKRRDAPAPSFGSLLRTIGFAHAPGVFAVLGFIPIVGMLVALVVPVWAVLTTVFAIRHTIGFSVDQAMATSVLATSATAIATACVVIVA